VRSVKFRTSVGPGMQFLSSSNVARAGQMHTKRRGAVELAVELRQGSDDVRTGKDRFLLSVSLNGCRNNPCICQRCGAKQSDIDSKLKSIFNGERFADTEVDRLLCRKSRSNSKIESSVSNLINLNII
jgi:hypothetical protein